MCFETKVFGYFPLLRRLRGTVMRRTGSRAPKLYVTSSFLKKSGLTTTEQNDVMWLKNVEGKLEINDSPTSISYFFMYVEFKVGFNSLLPSFLPHWNTWFHLHTQNLAKQPLCSQSSVKLILVHRKASLLYAPKLRLPVLLPKPCTMKIPRRVCYGHCH